MSPAPFCADENCAHARTLHAKVNGVCLVRDCDCIRFRPPAITARIALNLSKPQADALELLLVSNLHATSSALRPLYERILEKLKESTRG